MNPEMSLLEFIKKKLVHWFAKGPDIRLEDLADQPTLASEQSLRPATMAESDAMKEDSLAGSKKDHAPLPWKSIFALGLAIFAQLMLEPPARNILASVILYAAAAAMFITSILTASRYILISIDSEAEMIAVNSSTCSGIIHVLLLPIERFHFISITGAHRNLNIHGDASRVLIPISASGTLRSRSIRGRAVAWKPKGIPCDRYKKKRRVNL